MNGTFTEDDYGNLTFTFEDGTWAKVYWQPYGAISLGAEEGHGGEFDEEQVETNSEHAPADLVRLAYANTGRRPGPITLPS